ncbi:MurR/RpiR family transcriptional regulator [Lactiplantibacillus pingfangensis]|uniref:MurR/RpiR family transcriptional regulator n=1 Tax=Lactiplantibacillus pingfangensis TaxID=2559915 RepID=UPI0010F8444E|nr:MurR/RpiR family transcriptional regulator [Lactiplantibacillus pingfangensis]
MNLIDRLKAPANFTFNEQLIIQYLLAHPEDAANMSIYELAKQTSSSTSTIVRLCKKCGLTGFKTFKVIFARDLERYYQQIDHIDVNTPFEQNDSDLIIAKKIAQLTTEAVNFAQSSLSSKVLNQVTSILLKASKVYAIGVSDNFIRLRDLQLKLLRIGFSLQMVDLQAEQYHLALNSKPTEAALLVSYSGQTAEVVNDAKTFHQNGTAILAITGNETSPLAKYATETILLPQREHAQYQVSNFSSQLAVEYMLNVLYSCIFNRNFEKNYVGQQPTPISKFEF